MHLECYLSIQRSFDFTHLEFAQTWLKMPEFTIIATKKSKTHENQKFLSVSFILIDFWFCKPQNCLASSNVFRNPNI